MNISLQTFAREELKADLAKCTDGERHMFKRMYSPNNLRDPIVVIIENMDCEKLDWAMRQVKQTLQKRAEKEWLNNM